MAALAAGAICAVALLAAAACGDDPDEAPDKVVFMAGFKPQANLPFVAAYVAQEKGYFAEQGLDVEIRHAPRGGHLQLLLSGDVDFTTAAASVCAQAAGRAGRPDRRLRTVRPEAVSSRT